MSGLVSKAILQGYIVVPDEDLDEILNELPIHIKLTREENGCTNFQVDQSPSAVRRFDVYEEFIDQDSFETHQERVSGSRWGMITKNVSRHYKVETVNQ